MLDAFDAQQIPVRVLIGTTAEFSAVVNEIASVSTPDGRDGVGRAQRSDGH